MASYYSYTCNKNLVVATLKVMKTVLFRFHRKVNDAIAKVIEEHGITRSELHEVKFEVMEILRLLKNMGANLRDLMSDFNVSLSKSHTVLPCFIIYIDMHLRRTIGLEYMTTRSLLTSQPNISTSERKRTKISKTITTMKYHVT